MAPVVNRARPIAAGTGGPPYAADPFRLGAHPRWRGADAEAEEDDPIEAFPAHFLNIWPLPAARLRGRDEPLVAPGDWVALVSYAAHAGAGRLIVDRQMQEWTAGLVSRRGGVPLEVAYVGPSTTSQALTALRTMAATGALCHEGGATPATQAEEALVNRTAAAGLSLSPNCPRADLVRAAAWAAAALEGAGEEVRLEIL